MAGRVAIALLVLFVAEASASRNALRSSRDTVPVGEPFEISVVLDGPFASVDGVGLPLENLVIDRGPSVSSEFRWVDGSFSRTKTFSWVVRAPRPGDARAGPLFVSDRRGQQIRLPSVRIRVYEPSSTPDAIPRIATALPALQLELSDDVALVGEQIVASWVLYAEPGTVRGFRTIDAPALDGFWVEEIPQLEPDPSRIVIEGRRLDRIVVRRAALFALRDGDLTIAPYGVSVDVLRPIDPFADPFGRFEADVRELIRRSNPGKVAVREGGAILVGETSIECAPLRSSRVGPLAFDVTIRSRGNLRALEAPGVGDDPAEGWRVEELGVDASRDERGVTMVRRWRYFRVRSGNGSDVGRPSVEVSWLDPESGDQRSSRCEAAPGVMSGTTPGDRPPDSLDRPEPTPDGMPAVGAAAAGGAAVAFVAWLFWFIRKRDAAVRDEVRELMGRPSPREIRRSLLSAIERTGNDPHDLSVDRSEAGERYRAVSSLLDLMEKEPWNAESSQAELEARLRDLLRELRRRSSH